jgi:pimeloyl-ACP methyl ester carboxylesterase
MQALVIDPDQVTHSVLLFLHGKGEAGSTVGSLPLVCIHQTPPFQALLGRLPETVVIAPQAPPVPTIDDWNWRDHVKALAAFLAERYAKQRVVATGFSRGGLGVLQLISAHPDLIQAWAIVDPQPARDQAETKAVLPSPAAAEIGWLRYGVFRDRNDAWKTFSSLLLDRFTDRNRGAAFSSLLRDRLPDKNGDTAELPHVEMAVQAYRGSPLSAGTGKKNLYDFLGLNFEPWP